MFVYVNRRKLKLIGAGALGCIFMCAVIVMGGRLLGFNEAKPLRANSTNWGLSFQEAGKIPVGNRTCEELGKQNAYFCDNSGKKTLYLTFDAGYENGYMEDILHVLKKEKVPAAFFVVGTYIRDNPDLIKRMVRDGHIVGNHTMTHPDMSEIENMDAFKEEIGCVEDLYKEIIGKPMAKYYRPPRGNFSDNNLLNAKKLGYKTIFWSLAYVDWYVDNQPSEEEAFKKLIPRTHPGAIILLHSTSKTNARVLARLITNWKEEGYQFSSLDKLGKL